MDLYHKTIFLLEQYFSKEKNWQKLFLSGGCYWFANFLVTKIPGSYFVINRVEEHCALCINGEIYDIQGKLSKHNFHKASKREIEFMKKNYIQKFQTEELERFLEENL